MLGQAHLGCGDFGLARQSAEQAVIVARQRRSQLFESDAQLTAIEAALAEAERVIATTGAHSRAPFVHMHCAELARLSGDAARHQRELREALRVYTEIGAAGRDGLKLGDVLREPQHERVWVHLPSQGQSFFRSP
jgi:hypothetical protein